MTDIQTRLTPFIRDVPDFPKEGILFKDITPLLSDADTLAATIDHLADHYADKNIDVIVGIESRGFIFGTALAYKMGKGIALVRKPGKLPWKTRSIDYALEYGTDTLEIHTDAVEKGARVLVVDDLLATGGTAGATCALIEQIGGVIAGVSFVIELGFLNGRAKLEGHEVYSILEY